MPATKDVRLRLPLMAAFRAASEAKDSRVKIDQRDEGGERVIAGRRATGRFAISETQLQKNVARDLEQLMNTVNFGSTVGLAAFDEVRSSVLNYGFPDVVHRTIDEIAVGDIGREIEEALTIYETRLVPGSVAVRRDHALDDGELKVRFLVRAELRCDPLNVPVEFIADLERDTGKIAIRKA